jgi:Rod binding domain-containing protein
MEVPALQRHVQASQLSPERLANNPHLSQKAKISEASRQFEALLLRQILDSSQKPVIKTKLNPDSTASGIYRDLVTTNLADAISKSGTFGLASTFEQQLNRQAGPAARRPNSPAPTAAQGVAKAMVSSPAPGAAPALLARAPCGRLHYHDKSYSKPH